MKRVLLRCIVIGCAQECIMYSELVDRQISIAIKGDVGNDPGNADGFALIGISVQESVPSMYKASSGAETHDKVRSTVSWISTVSGGQVVRA